VYIDPAVSSTVVALKPSNLNCSIISTCTGIGMLLYREAKRPVDKTMLSLKKIEPRRTAETGQCWRFSDDKNDITGCGDM
jgi:hypothetical protein